MTGSHVGGGEKRRFRKITQRVLLAVTYFRRINQRCQGVSFRSRSKLDSDRTCTQVRFLNFTDSFLNAMLVFSFDGILLVLTDNLVKWFYLFLEEWLAKYYWIDKLVQIAEI